MTPMEDMTKSELILEIQKFGKQVNPGKKKEELIAILKELQNEKGGAQITPSEKKDDVITESKQTPAKPLSDTDKILNAIGGLASNVKDLQSRVGKIENGSANEFKEAANKEDIESAEATKHNSNVDPRIISIVEKTLGVDFGIEVEGYDDKPGMMLTILVPQRLSPIPTNYRPVKTESGEYKIDARTKLPEEEEYWPGDRRSVAMGANDSFEVVQKHVNRVRSFIMATYQKSNKPQPQFNTKS